MSATHLVVVPPGASPDGAPEPLGERIRRLQAEARAMAREQVEVVRAALADVSTMAREIAEGGEAYPVGVREVCRRVAEETSQQAKSLGVINDRAVN